MNDGGKGSARRPAEASPEQVEESWQRIFGKKDDGDKVIENGPVSVICNVINITPTKLKELLAEAHRIGFEQGEEYCSDNHVGYTESAKAHWQCVEKDVAKIYNDFITPYKEAR